MIRSAMNGIEMKIDELAVELKSASEFGVAADNCWNIYVFVCIASHKENIVQQ